MIVIGLRASEQHDILDKYLDVTLLSFRRHAQVCSLRVHKACQLHKHCYLCTGLVNCTSSRFVQVADPLPGASGSHEITFVQCDLEHSDDSSSSHCCCS